MGHQVGAPGISRGAVATKTRSADEHGHGAVEHVADTGMARAITMGTGMGYGDGDGERGLCRDSDDYGGLWC